MKRLPGQPLGRWRVLAGTAVAALLLFGLIAFAEALRHPTQELADVGELGGQDRDPRVELDCPTPEPREDVPREEPATTAAAPTDPVEASAEELINCPQSFDGRTVRYRGEVIGGLMDRRDGTWVQVNDDVYAAAGPLPAHQDYQGENVGIGVFLPADLDLRIGTVGGPRTRGDLVEVVGVFRRVDPDSHEVTVIRASGAKIVRPGEALADPALGRRQVAAGLLSLFAAAMVVTERTVARRRYR